MFSHPLQTQQTSKSLRGDAITKNIKKSTASGGKMIFWRGGVNDFKAKYTPLHFNSSDLQSMWGPFFRYYRFHCILIFLKPTFDSTYLIYFYFFKLIFLLDKLNFMRLLDKNKKLQLKKSSILTDKLLKRSLISSVSTLYII